MKKVKFNEDLIRIIISIVFLVLGMIFNENIYLLVISYVFVSKEVYFNALKNIKNGKIFDENFLMIIATLGAFYIKEYPEAVLVMLLFSIGEYLSDLAVDNSKKAIVELMDLRSDKVNIKDKGCIDVKESKVGDIFIVAPGEKIPLDGIIINGTSHIDTKSLTGESVPRKVNLNDTVLSGTINLDSVLEIKATKTFKTSTASKIIEIIENSEEKKTKTEKFITRFSKIYTPIVVILAILVIIVPVSLEKNFTTWVYRALEMLVISCPCALVISVPLTYFTSIGKSSKEKILVKGSDVIDNLNKIDTIIFDKTGTITKGNFVVQDVIAEKNAGIAADELLRISASCELSSTHPIAVSIVDAAKSKDIVVERPISQEEIAGHGIKDVLPEGEILCGNRKLMDKYHVDMSQYKPKKFGTEVLLAKDGKFIGHIVIADTLKPDASSAIQALKRLGKTTAMLTGDGEESAKAVDKLQKLQEVRQTHGAVMFVGDGINDAPVLAGADVGAAMGSGADAAIEAADVVFMTSEVSAIPQSLSIAKRATRIAVQNVVFALIIKIAVMILGLCGFASMWLAVFADTGVAMLCILNSIRILYSKIK